VVGHLERWRGYSFLITGLWLAIITSVAYSAYGFSVGILLTWLASLFLTGAHFFRSRTKVASNFQWKDFYVGLALLLIFAPAYLLFLYQVPSEVNTDEIAVMVTAERATINNLPDLFSLSDYFAFPSLEFIVLGWSGRMLGGVNLLNMRIVHALLGLGIVVLTYIFFRVFTSRIYAVGGAMLVSSNHALMATSRMAIRNDWALLLEIGALSLLLLGLKRRCPFYSFLGGAVVGLSFYFYFPGRFTIVLWLVVLGLIAVFFKRQLPLALLGKLAAISLLGSLLVAAPLGVSTLKDADSASSYGREQLLIFPEGRDLQQAWTGVPGISEGEAIKRNVLKGIATFNSDLRDEGNIYFNSGHGFVDPLTGVLIWLGFIGIVLKARKREEDILGLGGFLFLWLLFSLFITKNPNYTRLIVILPFVAFLVVEALKDISTAIGKLGRNVFRHADKVAFGVGIFIIVAWNLAIFGDYVKTGLDKGDVVGGTGRYIEDRKGIPDYSFYLAANNEYPYYDWGGPGHWKDWMGFFTGDSQEVKVLLPGDLERGVKERNFTIFMSQKLWDQSEETLIRLYPALQEHNIKPDGSLLAVEVN